MIDLTELIKYENLSIYYNKDNISLIKIEKKEKCLDVYNLIILGKNGEEFVNTEISKVVKDEIEKK